MTPLLDLLSGHYGWPTTLITWIGALRLPMKLVSSWLQQFLTRFVADVAASPDTADDVVLRRVLGSVTYRFIAFTLDAAVSLKLPTVESLDRHQGGSENVEVRSEKSEEPSAAQLPVGVGAVDGANVIASRDQASTSQNPTSSIQPPASVLLTIGYALFTLALAGCSTTQPPPSAIEQKLFTIETNYFTAVVMQTNTVIATNFVSDPETSTPPTPVIVTNLVTVTTTNFTPQYAFTPNSNAAAIAQTAESIGNVWGVGGIVGTAIGALFSLWAWYRNRQARLSAATLAQVIETGRQILLSLPNGTQYDEAWKTWMIQHQADAGAIAQISQIVAEVVNTDSARGAAQEIVDLIQSQTQPKN